MIRPKPVQRIDRRTVLAAGVASGVAAMTGGNETLRIGQPAIASEPGGRDTEQSDWPVTFGLNTSTIRGQELSLEQQIDVVAGAGYDAIEPWVRDITAYVDGGGDLAAIRDQLGQANLKVCSAIGFGRWIVDDEQQRREGLREARREMRLVREIGGTHIAAPPIGVHQSGDPSPPLEVIANRYAALCQVGQEEGVTPQLELWGFSPTLSKLSELAYVVTGAAHPLACVLPDFYHIYKGGNDFESLSKIEASSMHCFHINDYPGSIPISEIADRDRVFPGDGDCDLGRHIAMLIDNGFRGTFSLELFNPDYWQRDALEVCREGLAKCKRVVREAMIAG